MNRSLGERSRFRVMMMLVLVLPVASVAGAFETGAIMRGEDSSSAAGHDVLGTMIGGDGSPLSGVRIALSGENVNQKTVSDADGAFRFTSVPAGSYSVVFKMKGKKKVKREMTVSTGNVDLGQITMD